MMNKQVNWIKTHYIGITGALGVVVALGIVAIPAFTLDSALITSSRVTGQFVAAKPAIATKFIEIGARVADPPDGVANSVIPFNTLIGANPLVLESGNLDSKENYSVSIQLAHSSGETGQNAIGDGDDEEVIGTLNKPNGEANYTFTWADPNSIPNFIGTYSNENINDAVNLWSYIRVKQVTMTFHPEGGDDIPVINQTLNTINSRRLNELTNTVLGATFASDASGGYLMKTKVPTQLIFGVFYPTTLRFRGLNTNFLWGIQFFGLKCPEEITVKVYRVSATATTEVADNVRYVRGDAILRIIFPYRLADDSEEVITDVMGANTAGGIDNASVYRYQLNFTYAGADPNRYGEVKDVGKSDRDGSFYIFFSKNQPAVSHEVITR